MARMKLTLSEEQVVEAVARWVNENIDGLSAPGGAAVAWTTEGDGEEQALVVTVEVETD